MKKIIYKLVNPIQRLYWFIFRPKTRGVKCVIQHNSKILMIRNTYGHKFWTFPGGGIHTGETLEDAIKREVKEEVGINVEELNRIGEFLTTSEYKRDRVTVFKARSENEKFEIDKGEILEAMWFPSNDLPQISEYAKNVISVWKQKEE